MKTYADWICPLCKRRIKAAGIATNAHTMKHVREGYYVEHPHREGFARTRIPFDLKSYQRNNPGPKDNPHRYFNEEW